MKRKFKYILIPPSPLSEPLIAKVPGLPSSQDSKVTDFFIDQFAKFSLPVIANVIPLYVAKSTTLSIVKKHVTLPSEH